MRNFYNGLRKLSTDELIQIVHDCEDILGACTVMEYSQLIGKSKRYIFDLIHSGRLKTFQHNGIYVVVVNDHLINTEKQ